MAAVPPRWLRAAAIALGGVALVGSALSSATPWRVRIVSRIRPAFMALPDSTRAAVSGHVVERLGDDRPRIGVPRAACARPGRPVMTAAQGFPARENATTSRRIVFVDDDPVVLDVMRDMLQHRRDRWDMVFTQSAEAALLELER